MQEAGQNDKMLRKTMVFVQSRILPWLVIIDLDNTWPLPKANSLTDDGRAGLYSIGDTPLFVVAMA